MKIEELLSDWSKDSEIDETELSKEALRIPNLHSKYLVRLSKERLKLTALNIQRKKLLLDLVEYYGGDRNYPEALKELGKDPWPKTVLKGDRIQYAESDDSMVQLNVKISYQKELVDVLEEILKSVNNRNFFIKNAIDYLRLTMGN